MPGVLLVAVALDLDLGEESPTLFFIACFCLALRVAGVEILFVPGVLLVAVALDLDLDEESPTLFFIACLRLASLISLTFS